MAEPHPNHVSGIYAITHLATGRQYIGSAAVFKRRWSLHKQLLKTGKHYARHLQNCWRKYGKDGFSFTVLEYVPQLSQWREVRSA